MYVWTFILDYGSRMVVNAKVVEMVDCSHKVNNHYKWHIPSLVQNLLEDHPSDMETLHGHHSGMARRVKWLEAHDPICVNGHWHNK
jgi:hypothetical protein